MGMHIPKAKAEEWKFGNVVATQLATIRVGIPERT